MAASFNGPPTKPDSKIRHSISRILGYSVTDSAADSLRRIVEAISFNDIAALFLFGIAVLAVVLLQSFGGFELFSLLILFGILVFYFRMSGTRVRLAELRNNEILLRLAEAERAPQPPIPGLEPPPRQARRPRSR